MSTPPPRRPGTPGPPRWRPRRTIPSAAQLGVRPSRLLARGVSVRCPACGGGGIFRRWLNMSERCPTCTLRFERVHGHWIGSLGTNTTVVFAVMFLVLLGASLISFPDPPGLWLLWVEVALAVLGPVAFFPPSRTLWTAIDLLMRPLRPGEIDPRFVVRDPHRDRPTGP